MTKETPSLIRSDSVFCQIRKFIEDGPMKRQILVTQIPLYEHVFVVDFGHTPATCRILLTGLESNGYTTVQYNVIAMQYNEDLTS